MEQRAAPTVDFASRWVQGIIVTFIFGFAILGYLAIRIYRESPPVPARVAPVLSLQPAAPLACFWVRCRQLFRPPRRSSCRQEDDAPGPFGAQAGLAGGL